MRVVAWMQPRDVRTAARSVVALTLVALLITVVFAPIQPGRKEITSDQLIVLVCSVLGILAVGAFARGKPRAMALVWAVGPFLAVTAITVVDLLTADASVGAMIFFIFPALYGASQLRSRGSIALTVATLVGAGVVAGSLLPGKEAASAFGYLAAAIITTSTLLNHSAAVQATLVEKLERQAAVDHLTGLVTRRVLDKAAQSAMSGAASQDGTSLVLLDVDNFKTINDHYGHPAGDEVLIQLANMLRQNTGPTEVVSRLGGDEVALLLPGCSGTDGRRRADQVVRAVAAHPFRTSDGVDIKVSVSVGVAHAPSQAVDLRGLYSAADQALYEAKRGGRNRVGTFSGSR